MQRRAACNAAVLPILASPVWPSCLVASLARCSVPIPAGAAGVAYALWHCARHAQQLAPAVSRADLLGSAERYARAALQGISSQPPERYGWSLLAGHAGVYATGALVFDAAAAEAEQAGSGEAAEALRAERERCVQHYAALSSLAASSACQEDEVSSGVLGKVAAMAAPLHLAWAWA